MRFKLTLRTTTHALIPFNYQYPLSAAIYRIIQRADAAFAAFLHNTGYGEGHKSFKLFTFSDLHTPFIPRGDRMQLTSGEAGLTVCFYLPQAAEHFIRGLFMHQQLEIADRASKTVFDIVAVEGLHTPVPATSRVMLQPLSPLVAGRKNERGHYDYRHPQDADFTECLVYNWIEKAIAARIPVIAGDDNPEIKIDVLFNDRAPKQRLITIKAGTDAETRIRGYTQFRLAVTASSEMLELALGAGLGLYNAMGCGCVEIIK